MVGISLYCFSCSVDVAAVVLAVETGLPPVLCMLLCVTCGDAVVLAEGDEPAAHCFCLLERKEPKLPKALRTCVDAC